jgi:hypothetical protein
LNEVSHKNEHMFNEKFSFSHIIFSIFLQQHKLSIRKWEFWKKKENHEWIISSKQSVWKPLKPLKRKRYILFPMFERVH